MIKKCIVSVVYHEHRWEAVTERCFLKSNYVRKNWHFIPLECIERTSADRLWENMFCYGARMNINMLLTYLIKISLILFMTLLSFYTLWNTSVMFSGSKERDHCHGMRSKRNAWKSRLIFSYLFCYLYK